MKHRTCARCERNVEGPMKHYVTATYEWKSVCLDCWEDVHDRQWDGVAIGKTKRAADAQTALRMRHYLRTSMRISSGVLLIALILYFFLN